MKIIIIIISVILVAAIVMVSLFVLNTRYATNPDEQNVPGALFLKFGSQKKLTKKFIEGKKIEEQKWKNNQANLKKIENFSSCEKLVITPLIEYSSSSTNFFKEPGVSYYIQVDKNNILFDLGYNENKLQTPPLLSNMQKLGISFNDINSFVISHNHRDHVGGTGYEEINSFMLKPEYFNNPKNVKIYSPIEMNHNNFKTIISENPTVIANGVATIGSIQTYMYFNGMTSEQALVVNLKNKGLVIIVGCGHQGLEKIITRVKTLFNKPIYAIIGGFHYPVSQSRIKIMGMEIQKYVGTGKLPWNPITIQDVKNSIELIKKEKPKIIAISAHDSCDLALNEFKKAFPNEWRELSVGAKIDF